MKETKEKITYDKLIAEIRTILNNDWKMTDKNNIIQGENDIYVLMELDQNSKKSSVFVDGLLLPMLKVPETTEGD